MRYKIISARHILPLSAIFMLLVLYVSLGFQPASAQIQSVEIIEIDTYTKSIKPNGYATYNWTVRNIDPSHLNFTIDVAVYHSDAAWKKSLSNSSFILPPHTARTFTLTITAPANITEGTANVTVIIDVKQNGSMIMHEKKNAVLSIIKPHEPVYHKILGYFDNPLPAPLNNNIGTFILTVLAWALISSMWRLVVEPIARLATSRTKTKLDDIILDILRIPITLLIFFYGVVDSLYILDEYTPSFIIEYADRTYQIVFILSMIYIAYRMFKDIIIYYGKELAKKTETNFDDIVIPVVEKLGVVVIGLIALAYLLNLMNVDLTMFVAGGVVVSMVLAFAAQDTLSNFFAGIFLLTDRPFKVGDIVILADGDWCEVRHIGLRTTRLFRYSDATIVSLPNNKLVNDKIANFTDPPDKGRVSGTYGVGYGSDVVKVKEIINSVINDCPNIIKDNEELKPIVRFEELGESSINFFVLVWIDDRKNRFAVKDFLNTEIYNRLNKAGVEIPFPQRTVWLKREKDAEKRNKKED